ncbi:MAG: hypothetical protein WCF54_12030 [Terracidiphilus sp.]
MTVNLTLTAQTGDIAAIQQKINTQFKATITTADRSDIVTAGDIVQIHKPGLLMYSVASPLPPSNSYKNGRIGQGWSGFGKDLAIGMLNGGNAPANVYPQRQFVPEEKCWVRGILVQKDGILIQLYSDPYDDVRYYANLKIPFPDKKTVPSVDEAMQLVAEVITVVPQEAPVEQPAAEAAAAAPQNQIQEGPPPPVPGEYISGGGSHFVLFADGSFTKSMGGGKGQGQYVIVGDNLTLTYPSTSFSQQLKIYNGKLTDLNSQLTWARTGDAPMPDITPPPPANATHPSDSAQAKNADSGPSLAETLHFIQEKLSATGQVSWAFTRSDRPGYTILNVLQSHEVMADPGACALYSTGIIDTNINLPAGRMLKQGGSVTPDDLHIHSVEIDSIPFKQIENITVEKLQDFDNQTMAEAAHPEVTFTVTPSVFVVRVYASSTVFPVHTSTTTGKKATVEKDKTDKANCIVVRDEETANKIAKAMTHAMELCGGGAKKDLF